MPKHAARVLQNCLTKVGVMDGQLYAPYYISALRRSAQERHQCALPGSTNTYKDARTYVAVTAVRSHSTTKSYFRHKITVYFVILRHCINYNYHLVSIRIW